MNITLVVPMFSLMFTIGLLLPLPSQGHQQPNIILIFQAGAHGTDISTGNQPGIPSLPPGGATPDAGSTSSPSPLAEGSYCPSDNQQPAGQFFPSYPGLGLAGGSGGQQSQHDRNHNIHNTGLQHQLGTKQGDLGGGENNYCSSR